MRSYILSKSEKRVRRQLVEAMLYEQLIPYKETAAGRIHLYGRTSMYECCGRKGAFGRVRVEEDSICVLAPARREATIAELAGEISDNDNLLQELLQTVKLSEWNECMLGSPLTRRDMCYEELESFIDEGHLYHPCYKARTGFTEADHQRFGPEAGQSFLLHWIAAPRQDVHLVLPEEEQSFWQRELGGYTWKCLVQELYALGGNLQEYTFLPVHPWQWRQLKKSLPSDILHLGAFGDSYRATQSVRTLWNETDPQRAHMKLPMNLVNTSSLRTLQAHSICAAPAISSWLQSIVRSDPFFQNTVLLEEYAGAAYEPAHGGLSGQLGAIWRQSLRSRMRSGEEGVPCTALLMKERDGQPFLDEWFARYGLEAWLERFLDVAILPVWHLLLAHGIAIEAHAQNMVLLHENGWPVRIALRDFHESVEFTREYVRDPELLPYMASLHNQYKDAPPDLYYEMSSVEALRELAVDTVFIFHLSELSWLLQGHYGYSEDHFWQAVQQALEGHVEQHPELQGRWKLLNMDEPYIYAESLLKKKVSPPEEKGYRHLIKNELSAREQAGEEIEHASYE